MEKKIRIGEKTYRLASDDNYLAEMGSNFEPHMVQLFKTLVDRDDVVADIGANIGLTAILFSTLARKVFAFEPSPSTYNILSENINRAGVTNVEPINLGLGKTTESLTITFSKNNRSGGYVSDKIRPEIGHITEDIQIDTVDRYFSNHDIAPTFLKIDVEGFEQNVIKGGAKFLQNKKPTIVMEMNHFCLNVLQRITIPDFLDFLRSAFPYLYAIDTDNTASVDLHDTNQAYFVMHEHVVRHRFPNLVAGFDPSIKAKLELLVLPKKQYSKNDTPQLSNLNGAGELFAPSIPESMMPGEVVDINITLTNKSAVPWHGYGNNPVLLSYHWLRLDGRYLVYDGERTELDNQSIAPDTAVQEVLRVVAPAERGRFRLVLTAVQEGISWLEDKGMRPSIAVVDII